MSQAGEIDVIANHPEIPTEFITDDGTAVPIANQLEILGTSVAAGSTPVETTGSGNTVTIQVQTSQEIGATDATKIGLAAFDSAGFDVDANGFVTLTGGGGATTNIDVDANTAPGTDPVVPNAGNIIMTGAQVATGVIGANVIRTNSLAANTVTIEIQRSTAVAATDSTKNGVSHFNSSQFAVDASGFVSLAGGGIAIDSIAVQTGTSPIAPTAAGLVTINGAVVAAGTNPVRTDGTGANTLAVEIQISQAIAGTDATKIGLAAFNSADFTVDANGFVSAATTASIETMTGNTGGALSPVANNMNTVGTGSITIAGSGNTLTTQLTGLTNHAVLVGAGTATITKLAVGTNGQVLIGSTAADPVFGTLTSSDSSISFTTGAGTLSLQVAGGTTVGKTITGDSGGALSPTAGNWNLLGSGSITTSGSGSTLTTQLTGLTNHAILVGAGTATITKVGPSATAGQVFQSAGAAADPVFSTATYPSTATGTGKVLVADGTNWVASTPTFPNASATSGKIIQSDGTNWVASTPTYPTTAGSAGKIHISDGTNIVSSTPTYPNSATSTGTILRADGTNWAASTATYPNTTTSQQILYSTATNTIGELTTANSKFPATNSSGTLAMRAFSVNVQVFTGNGTYTPTSGMLYCTIECLGGGAGGGGAAGSGTTITAGGGGGAGSYARKTVSAATIGASQTVTVGAAANGGTAGNNNGTAGNDTSVGVICIGKGGSAGAGAAAGTAGAGGLGGVAGTGDFTPTGQPGFTSYFSAATGVSSQGGAGGSSLYGGGGRSPTAVVGATAGNNATNYGSGGSGGTAHASATNVAGGNGSAGVVIITEYIIA